MTEGNFFKLVYRLFLNQIVSKIKLYRISLRWLDEKFFTTDCFKEYFIKYQPDLIYVPHFISPMDIELSKQAKKRGIFRVGMVNSWDNVSSRGLCRNLPDRMIGHNNIVKEHLVKYHDYNIKNIFVSGIPQFDIYFQEQRTPRKKFFERIGVEPNKKLVLFCPLGKRFSKTEYQVVKMLNQAIKDGRLQMNTHIFVRNNPVMNIYKSEEIEGLEHVTNEYPGKKFAGGGMNDWEFELDDIRHLADTLYHADVYVGCASTMVIDISSFNRPLIGINFDGNENLSFYQGVAWTFSSTHFKTIMETGGVSLANSETNLIELINKYLNNPELNKDNREKIIQEQYGAKDGKAGKRAGEYILKCLNELD